MRRLVQVTGPNKGTALGSENVNYSLVEDSQNLMQSFFESTTKQLAEIKVC